ncbi:MAG: TetR/AcrR family transcriptional regulator [Pseudomonadota bacterium]
MVSGMVNERHTALRARIVEIATRILEAEGLQALQARRIASEAGCAIGTLYNVYGGLDDVIIAANTVTLERLGEKLNDARVDTAGHDIEATLNRFALAYLDFATEHRLAWRTLFEHQMENAKPVPDTYREKQAQLFAIVESTMRDDVSDPGRATMVSRALFSAVHGIVALALDEKLGAYNADATREQIAFVVGAGARAIRQGFTAGETGAAD